MGRVRAGACDVVGSRNTYSSASGAAQHRATDERSELRELLSASVSDLQYVDPLLTLVQSEEPRILARFVAFPSGAVRWPAVLDYSSGKGAVESPNCAPATPAASSMVTRRFETFCLGSVLALGVYVTCRPGFSLPPA